MPNLREFLKRYEPLSRRAGSRSPTSAARPSGSSPMASGKPGTDTSRPSWPKLIVAGSLVVASTGVAGMIISQFLPDSTVRAATHSPGDSTFTAANTTPESPDDVVSATDDHGIDQRNLTTSDENPLPFSEVSGRWLLASVSDGESGLFHASTLEYIADIEWKEPNHLGLGMQLCNRYSLKLSQREQSYFVIEDSLSTQKLCNDDGDTIENYLGTMMNAQQLDVSHTTGGLTIRDSSNTRRFVSFVRHDKVE